MAGWLPLFTPSFPLSQRSTINISFTSGLGNEYRFINHFLPAEGFGPFGSAFSGVGTEPYGRLIDSSGFPVAATTGNPFGGGVVIPADWQYGATGSGQYYVFKFDGNAQWTFNTNTFSYVAGPVTGAWGTRSSSNVTVEASNRWHTTGNATSTYMIFQYTGGATLFGLFFGTNDNAGIGVTGNVRNVQFYRLDDEADLIAGNVFRAPYKQMLKNLCPGAIRFMDWHGGNDSRGMRFDTGRTLPNYACYGGQGDGGCNWFTSPPYGPLAFVDAPGTANQYIVPNAVPTTGNTKTTPGSMTHGELITTRLDSSVVRTGQVLVSNISSATTGVVTTSVAHGFNTGDIVVHQCQRTQASGAISGGSPTVITGISTTGLVNGSRIDSTLVPIGTTIVSTTGSTVTMSAPATAGTDQFTFSPMPKLHNFPCKITVTSSTQYSLADVSGTPVNTTGMGTFGGTIQTMAYVTLNVGSRGAFPIIFEAGYPVGIFTGYLNAGQYNNFIFDKGVSVCSDGAGNQVFGAWIQSESPHSNTGHGAGGVPVEICTALVNEVNALGPARPINMWMNIPYLGVSSMDSDYTTAANWGIGIVNVALNGANGYSGLTPTAQLYIEYANETWNSSPPAFAIAPYLAYRGYCRWPQNTSGDLSSMSTLRSCVAMNDIKTSAFYSGRVKLVLSGQGSDAVTPFGLNLLRIDGTPFQLNDASNPGGVTGNPMKLHNHFAVAGYFEPGATFDSANLSTLTTAWLGNIGNAAAQEANCSSYVDGIINLNLSNPNPDATETTWRYGKQVIPNIATKVATYGKSVIMYEGGWNKLVSYRNPVNLYYMWGTLDGTTGSITGVDTGDVSAVTVGDFVYGYGIPADSRITGATGTTITINKPTTVALTNGQFSAASPTDAFLRACKKSTAWKNAVMTFFTDTQIANSGLPADYITMSPRWGHIWPTSYGSVNTEWTDLDQVFIAEGARNRSLA